MAITWQLQKFKIKDLKEWDRNPRKLTEKGLKDLEASLTEFGLAEPLVINTDGTICGGHGRKKAMQRLGFKECDVYVPDRELTPKEFGRLNIRLNKNIAGIFDFDILSSDWETDELIELGFQEDELGITQEDMQGLTDEDETPEEVADPVTVLGDVWQLGNHRIICGDSTQADVVSKLLGNIKPHLMVTDPPYGVEYDAGWRVRAGFAKPTAAQGKVLNDDKADWREAWALFPGDVVYVWHSERFSPVVAESLTVCGFELRNLIVWAKSHLVMGRGHYHSQHESCWYAVKKKGTGHWTGDRKQTTLWQIDKPQKSETGHSTQKPVECMRRPIENNSSPGQAIYEPFSGSGTTIIAAEQTGRHCYAIEINPAYVDMAVIRWQNFTGQKAIHAETGQAFDDCKPAKQAA